MSRTDAVSTPNISRKQAALELLFFAVFAAAFVTAELSHAPKRWTLPGVLLVLSIYAVANLRSGNETRHDLGVRLDNFWHCALPTSCFTLMAALLVGACAWLSNAPLWRPELAVLLPLYPLYGIAQQLIFQGIVLRRLLLLLRFPWAAVACTAVAFSLVHLGDWRLVGVTFLAGAVWAVIFLRRPNVLALGISHGVLAALVYPLLLADNPLQRL